MEKRRTDYHGNEAAPTPAATLPRVAAATLCARKISVNVNAKRSLSWFTSAILLANHT